VDGGREVEKGKEGGKKEGRKEGKKEGKKEEGRSWLAIGDSCP
jgi:hypothetical protein